MKDCIEAALKNAQRALDNFLTDENIVIIEKIAEMIAQCFARKGKVLICGNGGSNADALHFAEEFTGRYRKDRRPLPVIAISESCHITCVGNDYGFDEIFARGVEAFGSENDVLILISTSGNSPNIIRALEAGKSKGLSVVTLLGKNGGKLKSRGDFELVVPGETTDRIQEIQMLALHIIIEMVERDLFPDNYTT